MTTAIVPALDEVPRIGSVLEVLLSYGFREIIVVDDGSTDGTAEVAGRFPVRIIRHAKNLGKGAALRSGVAATDAQTLFFCDADVTGLSQAMIRHVLVPVERGDLEMYVAARERARYSPLRFSFINTPLLDGQRALTRRLWERIPAEFKTGFAIEAALNHFAQRSERGLAARVFPEIRQSTKEEKRGRIRGTVQRYLMYAEIMRTNRRLQRLV